MSETTSGRSGSGGQRRADAPEVELPALIRTGAGVSVQVPARIRHRGRAPATIRVTVLGLDSTWAPAPLDLGVMAPGETIDVMLTLVPERGALGAQYPFTVAAEATPVQGGAGGAQGADRPVIGTAETALAVDTAERISMALSPASPHAVFGRRFRVTITNPSDRDRTFDLAPSAAAGVTVKLRKDRVDVPAERTVSVKGKLHIRRPTFAGGESVHAFAVTAQGAGAPEFAEGSVRSKPMFKRGALIATCLILVVALWIGLAVAFIPKISEAFKPKAPTSAPTTQTSQGPVAGGSGGSSASGGSGGSGNGGQGASGGPNGATGSGDGGSGDTAAASQITGTVTGSGADGATVTLKPTRLVAAGDAGATTAPGASAATRAAFRSVSTDALSKVTEAALSIAGVRAGSIETKKTDKDGKFQFNGVASPGYYLLTVSKPGYTTQVFFINAADLANADPLKIKLLAGTGTLSGKVTGPDGSPVGAATITVTDGTVTLQTSSVSESSDAKHAGDWSITGLSAPGSYLVTVAKEGVGAASHLVEGLKAGGSKTVDFKLTADQGIITGTITGKDALGEVGGIGGLTVTASNGKITRSVTTVSSGPLKGHFVLPNMPVGQYVLTISGPGFLTQTRSVTVSAGGGSGGGPGSAAGGGGGPAPAITTSVNPSNTVIHGMVTGADANGKKQGGLAGVGLVLTDGKTTQKTMTTSGENAGSFRFTGVPPGTYVLTATQFGRISASATVEVTPSSDKTVNLSLVADMGKELPATSHIHGTVLDSRTGGPLTCDRTPAPIASSDCVATVTVKSVKDPLHPSAGTVTYKVITTAAKDYEYTIPSPDDTQHRGLPPGLYTVKVSAPGYEDATTHVQVGQGQTVPAPAVSIPALGMISGTVQVRVGHPDKPSCVLVIPDSEKLPNTLPTSCALDSNGTSCTVEGIAGHPRCAITSEGGEGEAGEGAYEIRGLTHGDYQVLPIPRDPEYTYDANTAPVLKLGVGGAAKFNPVLNRYGRFDVLVESIDPKTGKLAPVGEGGATVAVDPKPSMSGQSLTTDKSGSVLVKGVKDKYTVSATGQGGGKAEKKNIAVALNQTTQVTLVLTRPIGAVIGRVVSEVEGKTPAVADAEVTVFGTVGYAGETPLPGKATVTTDSNGCYAIEPPGSTAALTADFKEKDGTTVTCDLTGEVGKNSHPHIDTTTTFITPNLTVSVSPSGTNVKSNGSGTNAAVTVGASGKVGTIEPIVLEAAPMTVPALTLKIEGPKGFSAPASGDVHVKVLKTPALAKGVSLAPGSVTAPTTSGDTDTYASALTFSDSQYDQGEALPGTYQFQITSSGFNSDPATLTLTCTFGAKCVWGPSPVLKQLPSISVDITIPSGGPDVDDWSKASVSPTNVSGLGVVKIAADKNNDGSDSTKSAHLTFNGNPSTLAASNGQYPFTVTVPGYGPKPFTVTCGADFSDTGSHGTGGCTAEITLKPLPKFPADVSVALDPTTAPGSSATLALGSKVKATISPNPNSAITVTVDDKGDGTGAVSWSDTRTGVSDRVSPGNYSITFGRAGFSDTTVYLGCGDSGCALYSDAAHQSALPSDTVTLDMLPTTTVTLNLAAPSGATIDKIASLLNGGTVTAYTSGGTRLPKVSFNVDSSSVAIANDTATATLIWNDGDLPFAGIATPGKYYLTVTGVAGYQDLTTANGADTVVMDCTSGTTCSWDNSAQPLETNPSPSGTFEVEKLPSTSTKAHFIATGPSGVPGVSLTEDGNGQLTWQQGNASPNLITPGDYQITAQLAGYTLVETDGGTVIHTDAINFDCKGSSDCAFPSLVLTKSTGLTINLQPTGCTPTQSNDCLINAEAAVKLTDSDGAKIADVTPTDGTTTLQPLSTTNVEKTTGGTWADGSYKLSVKAAGYRFEPSLDKDSGSSLITCTQGSATVDGFYVIPGNSPTTCTVTLTKLGSITGTTVWQKDAIDGTPISGNTEAHGHVALAATLLKKADGSTPSSPPSFNATSDANGSFTLTGDTDTEGLKAGTWEIKATATGFDDFTGVVDVTGDADSGFSIAETASGDVPAGDTRIDAYNGKATIKLTATPVNYNFIFRTTSGQIAPPQGKLSIDGTAPTPQHVYCVIDANHQIDSGGSTKKKCTVTGTDSKTLQVNKLPPGDYYLSINFADKDTYHDVPLTKLHIDATGKAQETTFALDTNAASINVTLNDSDGSPITSFPSGDKQATITLLTCDSDGTNCTTATTGSGSDATTTTMSSTATLTNLDAGDSYKLKVEAPGYATWTSSSTFSLTNGETDSQPVKLNAAAAKSVKLKVSLGTGDSADDKKLDGASVTLEPTGTDPRQKANSELSGFTVASDGTVDISDPVPSGTYKVVVTPDSATVPFALTAEDDLTITDDDNGKEVDKSATAMNLNAAKVPLEVNWSANTCASYPSGSISLKLAQKDADGSTWNDAAKGPSATVDDTKATATLYLPPGDYHWYPDISSLTDWTSDTINSSSPGPFTVDDPATTPSSSDTSTTITTDATNFTATVKVDGDLYDGALISPSTSDTDVTAPGDVTTGSGDNSKGEAVLCLPHASSEVTYKITATAAANDGGAELGTQSVTVDTDGTASPDTPEFDGYTVKPSVSIDTSSSGNPGSDLTADVTVTIENSGSDTVWTGTGTETYTKSSDKWAWAWTGGGSVVLPAGSHTLSAKVTSDNADDFTLSYDPSGGSFDPSSTTAPSVSLTYSTGTSSPTTTSATVTVYKKGGTDKATDATVKLYDSSGAQVDGDHTATEGTTTFDKLTVGDTYFILASDSSSSPIALTSFTATAGQNETITLTDSVTLKVQVEDKSDNSAIEGASVEAHLVLNGNAVTATVGTASGSTDANGQAKITGLPGDASVKVNATHKSASGTKTYTLSGSSPIDETGKPITIQ